MNGDWGTDPHLDCDGEVKLGGGGEGERLHHGDCSSDHGVGIVRSEVSQAFCNSIHKVIDHGSINLRLQWCVDSTC